MFNLDFRRRKMRILKLVLAAVAFTVLCAGSSFAYNPGDPEFRAIYSDAWHAGTMNVSQVNQLIADAKYCRANALVVQVRRRGDTTYPSIEPICSGFSASYDPLADIIQKCHNSSPRIEVHAWFVMNAIASSTSVPSNHPMKKYPQYLTKTSSGEQLIAGDYWFDPGHPGAEQYSYNIVMDVVNRYDVDGVNLDYIRFGSNDSGYNDVSVARFENFGSRYNGNFSEWRRAQITNLVRKIYANAIAAKPNIKVSADCVAGAPAPTTQGNYYSTQSYSKYYQDWPAWMQEGILDISMPMAYFDCGGSYGSLFDPWVCFARNNAYNRHAVIAPGVYDANCLLAQLSSTRNLACGPANGAAIYAYPAMNATVKDTTRAFWSSNAPVPTMPWKSSPTKGHIKGSVTFGGTVWVDGATITLTGPVNRTMYADGTGFFAFIDMPPGNYTVSSNAAGYGVRNQSVQVTAGAVATANIDYPLSSLVISNVQTSNETASIATITWDTNAGATSKVFYGLDRTCSQSTSEDGTLVTAHSVNLTGLTAGKTYYFRVYSKNPGVEGAYSPVFAFVTASASANDIIIESRSGGKNFAWYSDRAATGDSSAKSSASGVTAGIGSRYFSLQASYDREANFNPAITVPGSYEVFVTWPSSSSGGANIHHTVTYNGGSSTKTLNQSLNPNVWNSLGTFTFNAGASGSCGGVRMWASALDAGKRFTADAVKLVFAKESIPPSKPTNIVATEISSDFVTLEWAPSTDNTGVAGYLIWRGPSAAALSVVDASPTNSYTDNQVATNTRYYYAVTAYDASGNKSERSNVINFWTMVNKPTSEAIVCDKQSGVWHTSGPFTFTNLAGFGVGKVNYYRCVFDTNTTHTFIGSEPAWVGGAKSFTATSSAEPYYLHLIGYNQGVVAGEPADIGPFYLDTSAPETPVVTDEGAFTGSRTSLNASWSADDPESGVVGYQYAVGTTPGATNVVNWTATTDTEATINFAMQPYGAKLYVSVKAQNAAGSWSGVGNSDGITIATPVASVAAAKAMDNTGIGICIENVYVSAVFDNFFYVQDGRHGPGIRCEGGCSFAVGTKVTVGGTLGKNSAAERVINGASVSAGQ